eukprot:CAMPEP_0116007352 /NCGR_PEP_ID=MMETSP0321-20121206/2251_1 /TAXON_ID=163516 /ORGANISM="Leptocylindrus danicus var. danicus, Strain B650" /LENGTH=764 /DNA_ID=CAMNT_0003476037 /DNA_START=21 /DNA_END=2316 /DNA_ORIENTATION=-
MVASKLIPFVVTATVIGNHHGVKGTILGGGIVSTYTDVQPQADIALDLRDMEDLLSSSSNDALKDIEEAKEIYFSGKHSAVDDTVQPPVMRSLFQMSADTINGEFRSQRMHEPTYLFHIHGLRNEAEQTGNNYLYAVVYKSFFDDVSNPALAVESAVALNLWMFVSHEIYDAIEDCKAASVEINREVGLTRNDHAAHALDEAIAYWIGTGQDGGRNRGHALYSLAQRAGELFGTNVDGGEAKVNTEIIELYHEGRSVLAFSDSCTGSENDDALARLHSVANRIHARMMIPLMQMLIHGMREQDIGRVGIYARAVVPQISACSESRYQFLKSTLIDNDYTHDLFLDVLHALQRSFDCLGFSCEDIGAYKTSVIAECADVPADYPIAGYTPTTDVREHAKIDLDVKQIEILSMYNAFTTAGRYYMYGKNSKEDGGYRSLHGLATSTNRAQVDPWFNIFNSYFGSEDYADVSIRAALDETGAWAAASKEQRSASIVNTAKTSVMTMYGLREFYDARANCLSGGNVKSSASSPRTSIHRGESSWDRGIAFFTGSLEGGKEDGSDTIDGQLFFNVAKQMCVYFGTCNSRPSSSFNNAKVNEELLALFISGKGLVVANTCEELSSTIKQIESLLLVALFQGTVHFAILSQNEERGTTNSDVAIADAYTKSILPLIHHYDEDAGLLLEGNLVYSHTRQPVVGGIDAVTQSLNDAINAGLTVDCTKVGAQEGVGLCPDEFFSNSSSDTHISAPISVLFEIIILGGASLLLLS